MLNTEPPKGLKPVVLIRKADRKYWAKRKNRDPYYGTYQITRLQNVLMRQGRRHKVMAAIRELMLAAKEARWDFLTHFLALQPLVKRPFTLRPAKVTQSRNSHALKYVPVPISLMRQYSTALEVFTKALDERKEHTLGNKLIGEFNDLFVTGRSVTMAKTVELHKVAKQSLINLRYRWQPPKAKLSAEKLRALLGKNQGLGLQRYAKPIHGVVPDRPRRASEFQPDFSKPKPIKPE